MARYQDDDVARLVEAMDNLLDDMGKDGFSVCLFAKAFARMAFEPFRTGDDDGLEYSLESAHLVLEEVGY